MKKAAARAAKPGTTRPGTPDAEPLEREIPQLEKDAVSALLQEIEQAKKDTQIFRETKLKEWRRYSWGSLSNADGDAKGTTRTNLIFATQATLLPHIYAKNPEIAVAPTEAVSDDEYEAIKGFCTTAQVMLNRLLVNEGKLKRRIKANIRSTMTTGIGWMKLSVQKSLVGDPIIVRRANDVQDNLRRIEYLVKKTKSETDVTSLNLQKAELEAQLKGMMSGTEVKTFKGFVLDRVATEDILVLDRNIREFDDYVDARRLAMGVWMEKDEYEETFKEKPTVGTTTYGQPPATDSEGERTPETGKGGTEFVRVWEVWDKATNTVKTVAEGGTGWARAPYVPEYLPERWYTLFALCFNAVEGRFRPLSDVELLSRLQDEYNTTRFLFAETRKDQIPVRVFRKGGGLTEEDIRALVNRRARQFIGVEGNPQVPIAQDVMQLEGVKMDPAAFDVTIIRNDMDMLVGLSDASRANLIQAKTATEAEIMRQALMHRAGERQDANEDYITDIARAALEMMLRCFTPDEVKQIAGADAVWPTLSVEEIFRRVDISVRAGSTGKPNQLKEREQWATIMPIINDTMTQVAELRMQGHWDLAQTKVELLKETLTRYDERIDVDRFIPKEKMGEDGQPQRMSQMMQEAVQIKEAAAKQQEELAALQQEQQMLKTKLLEAGQAEQAKIAQIQTDEAIAVAQERAKEAEQVAKAEAERTKQMTVQAEADATAAAEVQLANIEAANKLAIEQEKQAGENAREDKRLASEERIAKITADASVAGKLAAPAGKKKQPGAGGEAAEPDAADTVMGDLKSEIAEIVKDAFAGRSFAGPLTRTRTPDGKMVLRGKRLDGTDEVVEVH